MYSSWTPEQMPTGVTRTLAGGVDYNVTPNDRWTFRGSASVTHTHETDGTDVVQENYLSGGNTYAYRFNRLNNKRFALENRLTPLSISVRELRHAAEALFPLRAI